MSAIDISHLNLYFKVFHEEFDPNRVYKAIAFKDYGETAWAQILFCNERGMMYSVIVYKTRCVSTDELSRYASESEKLLGPAKPKGKNSALDELDKLSQQTH